MDKKIKRKWIKALRSGKYNQGLGALCQRQDYPREDDKGKVTYVTEDAFCCLGVLVNITCGFDGDDNGGELAYLKTGKKSKTYGELPKNLRKEFGISKEEMNTLMDMNDFHEANFDKIADYIEDNM